MRRAAGEGLKHGAAWLSLLAVHCALLWLSGAFSAEFGEHPDEPSHFMNGLLVRDYLAAGAPWPPMRYAEVYYVHYPKITLGHHPPLFALLEGLWMLVFPTSRASALALLAILAATSAWLLYRLLGREFGAWTALGAGLLLILSTPVQHYCGMVMAEAPALLFFTGALLCYSRYLETERPLEAACFGALAALAILTKQVTAVLAAVPLGAVLLTFRFRLLRRWSFWLPALIVIFACEPWSLLCASEISDSLKRIAGPPSWQPAPAQFLRPLVYAFGSGIFALSLAGVWARIVRPLVAGRPPECRWAVWIAPVLGLGCAHLWFAGSFETRHLIYLLPALLAFAAAGARWFAGLLPATRLAAEGWTAAVSLLAVVIFWLQAFGIPQRRYVGYAEAAKEALSDKELASPVAMVSADGPGEGAFVAELASREPRRPERVVLRAAKVLARSSWRGGTYAQRLETVEEVSRYLDGVPVGVIVVGVSPSTMPRGHERLVRQLLAAQQGRWALHATFPQQRRATPQGAEVQIYRRREGPAGPPGKIRIDMGGRLGRVIED